MNSIRKRLLSAMILMMFAGCASTNSRTPKIASKAEQVKLLLPIAAADINDNDSTGALQILAQVRDMDDSVAEEYYLYSLAYLHKSEMRLAVESAKRAIKLNPNYSAAKNTLGRILLDEGKYEEAEKYLLEAANDLLFRDAYLPKTNLGFLYYKEGNLDKAEMWLTKAIQDGGSLVCLSHYYRGQVRSDKNQLLNSERDFAEAARGNCSGMSDAHIAFGKTLIREKKYDEARAKFVEIQRLFPSSDASDQATQYLREIP
jgi:type IV pilus assembly protein PilF